MASILVVDDDPQVLELMQNALTHAGHQVEEASNGKEGLKNYEATLTSIIVSLLKIYAAY